MRCRSASALLSALALLAVVLLVAAGLTRQFAVWHDEYSVRLKVERTDFAAAYAEWVAEHQVPDTSQTPE
ncbi:hypothetical protein [Lacticaseibacillus suihuaensis]